MSTGLELRAQTALMAGLSRSLVGVFTLPMRRPRPGFRLRSVKWLMESQ